MGVPARLAHLESSNGKRDNNKLLSQPAGLRLPLIEPLEEYLFNKVMAIFRSKEKFSAALEVWMREASSEKLTSNTQGNLFSICQCARTLSDSQVGLVMPNLLLILYHR